MSRTSRVGKSMSEFQGDGKNMLILENGEKLMEDGLETKAASFFAKTEKEE